MMAKPRLRNPQRISFFAHDNAFANQDGSRGADVERFRIIGAFKSQPPDNHAYRNRPHRAAKQRNVNYFETNFRSRRDYLFKWRWRPLYPFGASQKIIKNFIISCDAQIRSHKHVIKSPSAAP